MKKLIAWTACIVTVAAAWLAGFYVWKSRALPAPAANMGSATREHPFMNSLGMRFVPVAITGGPSSGKRILFSIWDTRVRDYRAYAEAEPGVDASWQLWRDPYPIVKSGANYPVVNVSWEDAKGFCAWLTRKERTEGRIGPGDEYRLPTDHEWSCAAGIGTLENADASPASKDDGIAGVYPWGTMWPPPWGAGNYNIDLKVSHYDGLCPVGCFAPDKNGLHDMGGNAWQWCEDWCDPTKKHRVARGASWEDFDPGYILSSAREQQFAPSTREIICGFRCVLAPAD